MLRFGIAGTGAIVPKNAKAILDCDMTELVYIGGRNPEKAQALCEKFGAPHYGTLDDLVQSEHVDAVYLALPTGVRAPWVLKAIKNNKHVLVDKPVAASVKEAEELTEAAKKQGVIFMDGTMWLQASRTEEIRSVLHQERLLGDLKYVHAVFSAFHPEKDVKEGIRGQLDMEPFGAIGETGWYPFGAILFAYDYEMPSRVSCFSRQMDNGVFYHMWCRLEWKDGRVAQLDSGYGLPLRQYFEIVGAKGILRVNDYIGPPVESNESFFGPTAAKSEYYWIMTDDRPNWIFGKGETRTAKNVKERHEVEMFYNFANAVKDKKQNEYWVKSSVSTVRVIEAAIASAKKNGEYVQIE